MEKFVDFCACGLVCFGELIAVCLFAVLVQGLVYRLTGFSIYNTIKKQIEKEIYPAGKHMYISSNKK